MEEFPLPCTWKRRVGGNWMGWNHRQDPGKNPRLPLSILCGINMLKVCICQ